MAKCGSTSIMLFCNYGIIQKNVSNPYTNGISCSSCSSICSKRLCKCSKICQNGGNLNMATCTCECPAFTTGDQCENILCRKTDKQYGCLEPGNDYYCHFINTKHLCPFTCGFCNITYA